ncbi:MAG: cobyrinate a,c-diamide synthase [candidate division Zixibacteria bacterium]|nr:cobyrinate a,c-diamide synthase [candidate division Zixibacteria bacterium]
MPHQKLPRIIIAGLSGDSGKTIVSLGLISALKGKGLSVSGFKKGPDYIDSAWLSRASGKPGRNLDVFLMGEENVMNSFAVHARYSDISVVEGNRGLYDGIDAKGQFSTAELAKLLDAPVILVLDCTKSTRTVAAVVHGCLSFDPDVRIAGVILNRVAGKRHEEVITEAIGKYTRVPVLGAIPKLPGDMFIPGRHLGLVTPEEHELFSESLGNAADVIEQKVDVAGVVNIANSVDAFEYPEKELFDSAVKGEGLNIGVFRDSAFTFYYPENLEALEAAGAKLVEISSMTDCELPEIDALYIGGGFPETHVENLTRNRDLMESVKGAAESGLPIYAECGGLIYLSQELIINDKKMKMAGVLPVSVKMHKRPRGHGYSEMTVEETNAFLAKGLSLKGHEFHYTGVHSGMGDCQTALNMKKGDGCFDKRDGLLYKNVMASYSHIHVLGCLQWAEGLLKAAALFNMSKKSELSSISV